MNKTIGLHFWALVAKLPNDLLEEMNGLLCLLTFVQSNSQLDLREDEGVIELCRPLVLLDGCIEVACDEVYLTAMVEDVRIAGVDVFCTLKGRECSIRIA